MRICAIGRLNLRKTSRRDDIDEGLQLVFGNGCGSKTRFAQRFINKFKAKSGDIGSKLKILQQIQNDDCDDNEDMSNIEMSSDSDSRIVCNRCHTLLPASDATTTAIILKGTVVVDDLENLPQAMSCL
ncbi:hypothetical protein F2P79_021545 [Pimephales promelas]|nr:hypothetical protein F2P79_021545 [Pimephales promelas]